MESKVPSPNHIEIAPSHDSFSIVKAKVYTDSSGRGIDLPVLLTPSGVVTQLLEYSLSRAGNRSLVWIGNQVRYVKLFLEYFARNPHEANSYRLFMNFAQKLHVGTYDLNVGLDKSELCWRPRRSLDVQGIVTGLTDFFDYVVANNANAVNPNPRYLGGRYEQMLDEAAYQHRREKAFLGHGWATNASSSQSSLAIGRMVRVRTSLSVEPGDTPAFPEEKFLDLLLKGFKVGRRYDYRSMLITVLLHGAGFRASEPFHLYVTDVFPDPVDTTKAVVMIHHPAEGAAPKDWVNERGLPMAGNRRAYLQEKYAMKPRQEIMGKLHAGWKGGRHERSFESYYFRAYWFHEMYAELFLKLWYKYLEERLPIKVNHPFAFINMYRGEVGNPYSLSKFSNAHAAAVERIGLEVSKALGTTPHGHRHAFGRRLQGAGFSAEQIRIFMHHSAIESQAVYTQPSLSEKLCALKDASAKLSALPVEHLADAIHAFSS